MISNLVALYQKKYIGRLSAFCGAVSAGAAAGAGIAYLLDQSLDTICHTIVNALAITSGLLCDGAKPSCAAKIAASVDAGIMGCMRKMVLNFIEEKESLLRIQMRQFVVLDILPKMV